MAGEATNINQNSSRWLRESTRAAILEAARKLVDTGGIEQLSLSGVAFETGFAPATVYAYFTSKNDLLVATVANDLAALAQTMRDVYPFADGTAPAAKVSARDLDEVQAKIGRTAQAIEPVVEAEPEPVAAAQSDSVAAVEAMAVGVGHEEQPTPAVEEAPQPDAVSHPSEPVAEPASSPVADAADQTHTNSAQPEFRLIANEPVRPRESEASPFSTLTTHLPTVSRKRRLLERKEIGSEPLPLLGEKTQELVPHPDRVSETDDAGTSEPSVTARPVADLASLREHSPKTEPPKADAWLERRLRIFEKLLSDVETRLGKCEQNATPAVAIPEDFSRSLDQRFEAADKRLREGLENLAQRLEQSEKRPRGIPPDLRATIDDLYARLETLEAGHNRAPDFEALEAQWDTPAPEQSNEPQDEKLQEEAPAGAESDTFLSAARRAALAAAQMADAEDRRKFSRSKKRRWSRTRYLLAISVALVVLVVVYGFVLRDYFAGSVPAAHAATMAQQPSVKAMTAQDRLAAMAHAGNVNAELVLGLDYLNGKNVAKNPAQAVRWLALAADSGEPVAQYWFGTLYERGLGVHTDASAAFRWYRAAALQGNRHAIYNVAVAYAVGRGVKQDLAEAAQWFRRAADLGYVDAQYNLAVLYERGQGLPQSLKSAYQWYAVAAAAGDKESKARIDALSTQMSQSDLADARDAAANFHAMPLNKVANSVPAIPGLG